MNELTYWAEALSNFIDAFSKQSISFADAVSPSVLKLEESVSQAGATIQNLFYQEYLRQGTIYGETQEGFLRWADEIGEIHRLETKIREIRERHHLLRSLK